MDDNQLARQFDLGDRVIYTASDPVRTPQVLEYPAMVISSADISPKGVKFRIEYERDGRTICSWVQAKRLRRSGR